MQGTITIGDVTLTFAETPDGVDLHVQDCLSGRTHHQRDLEPKNVRAALIVMLDGEENELPEEFYELAEAVQPSEPELRFIP